MAEQPNPFAAFGDPPGDGPGAAPPQAPPPARSRISRRAVLAMSALGLAVGAALVLTLGVFGSGAPTRSPSTAAASSPVTSPHVFFTKEAAICAQARQTELSLGTPTSANLVVWTQSALAASTTLVRQFGALTPPAHDATAFDKYVTGLRAALSQLREMAAAANARNTTRVEVLAAQTPAATTEGDLAARAAGFGCSSGASSSGSAQDASAEELARSAQVAIETWATDHTGSYANATPKALNQYESTIQVGPGNGNAYIAANGVSILDGGKGYVVTATATNGDTFSVERAANGTEARSCTTAAGNSPSNCSASHTW